MSALTDVEKFAALLRAEGVDGVARKVTRRAAERFGGNIDPIRLRTPDIADSADLSIPAPPQRSGMKAKVGWVITPPGPASGGHTTIFRFVEALERAGHRCVLYVYDAQHESVADYAALIRRWWPRVQAEVRPVSAGMRGMDAYVATAWTTAHVLATRPEIGGERFYLVQDFEPWFYPRGTAAELAEDTYRFGFHTITIGHMLAAELKDRYGYESTVAEFGCDTDVYTVTDPEPRDGVVFYAKPGVARRGYELGVMALEHLARLRPDIPIHTFGIRARALPFKAHVHAHLDTASLNRLYNRCAVGLSLSFSNISLIPFELLAAGVVPVMNDFAGLRANLSNEHVVWSRATPRALADAILEGIRYQNATGAHTLRRSVDHMSWRTAEQAVVTTIERKCAK
jgi:hypothetical protein